MNNKLLVVLSSLVLSSLSLSAQEKSTKHKENFFGLGRAVVSNETLNDTTDKQTSGATTNGYTLFDLGVKMQRNEVFKAHAILRVRNEFGGFYGDGVSFDFRELRLGGTIAKKINYEIGENQLVDLSMGMSANFETGIEEGSTMVRIGTALFGPRPT